MPEKYSEWKNTTSGHLGVVKHNDEGKPKGISVRPGGVVLLSERDRIATANAPANPANNPFQNGALQCIAPDAELSHRRPIGDASQAAPDPDPEIVESQETGAAAEPQGEAPQGQAAPHEEVAATPPPPAEQVAPASPAPEPVKVAQEPKPTPTPQPKPAPDDGQTFA